MVSKDKYYERKAASLCTKCGKSLEGSPSQVRCLSCHNKLKNKRETKKLSSECSSETNKKVSQKETIESLKKNALLSKVIDAPKICGLCGEAVNSFNLFCQKCIKTTVFTKADAISRYGSTCGICNEENLRKLKIVSSDISISMKHRDQALFKLICYRRTPPSDYKTQCHTCYWTENVTYVKNLKKIFYQCGVFEEFPNNDDVIDIT